MHIRAVGATEIFFWKVANIFEGDGVNYSARSANQRALQTAVKSHFAEENFLSGKQM